MPAAIDVDKPVVGSVVDARLLQQPLQLQRAAKGPLGSSIASGLITEV